MPLTNLVNCQEINNSTVKKRNGTFDSFNLDKILSGIDKSAQRSANFFRSLTNEEKSEFTEALYNSFHVANLPIKDEAKGTSIIETRMIEKCISTVLGEMFPDIQVTYDSYNNWKSKYADAFCKVYSEIETMLLRGDRNNANTNSSYVSTKRCLGYNILNKELYQMNFMTPEELKECRDGYIYIHDMVARNDTFNCCLCDMKEILTNGFEMGDMDYTEASMLNVAFNVILAVIKSAAAQQYGGFTVPQIDKILGEYAQKSYDEYAKEYIEFAPHSAQIKEIAIKAHEYAMAKVRRDYEQGFQAMEYDLNTIGSSRGDYPFVTITFGLGKSQFERMATESVLKVRKNGQGRPGFKKIVLFPKLVFLYDKNLHGEGMELEYLFDAAIECSSKAMYPDYLSLTGDSYVSEIYKKYGEVISPMGCRAFLSAWYERGGMYPADENDKPVFVGRANLGVVSLNLPMILQKSREEEKDFYEVLDYYLEMIRSIHKRTKTYLGKLKASCNPLMFCQGGLWGGHLKPDDCIAPVLKSWTASFGVTALHETQMLYNGKRLTEDSTFVYEVMKHINAKTEEYKAEDGMLYAIYATPAESLALTQVLQFRKKYGYIKGVSDKDYFTNSFHCAVFEDITGPEKQDYEKKFWDLFNGGKIQYVRYPVDYNIGAIKSIVTRAMDMGFYEGVNLAKCYCEDCGYEQLEMDVCPKCGSQNLTKIDRVSGYLGYTQVKGDTRMNHGKLAEIADRKSM